MAESKGRHQKVREGSIVFRIIAALALVATLAACGGGGGDGPVTTGVNQTARDLAGLSAPAETPAAQRARAPTLVSRADSLILSSLYGETTHPALPTFRASARCSGTRCTVSEPRSGYSLSASLSDLEFADTTTIAIGTKHRITLMSSSGSLHGTELTGFGAWMQHAGFAVQTEDVTVEGTRITGRYGQAGGDLTGVKPVGGATWRGVMVGRLATGSSRNDRLVGDAALNYDFSLDVLDVAFSSIVNIDRGRAHSVALVRFEDLQIGRRGTFRAGAAGNRIQGGFYGPGHAEAAGIFEQSNIVGAFGARKQ